MILLQKLANPNNSDQRSSLFCFLLLYIVTGMLFRW